MEKRLYRSRTNRVIGGVCGGLGEYLGVDPVVIRLIWAITFFLGGVGFIAYIICLVVIPETPSGVTQVSQTYTSPATLGIIIGAVIIIAGGLLLLGNIFQWSWRWGWWLWSILLPLALIGLGIFLMIRKRR
jgi:phage shock protein PspC (stress-responsive transcriptional regulator)